MVTGCVIWIAALVGEVACNNPSASTKCNARLLREE